MAAIFKMATKIHFPHIGDKYFKFITVGLLQKSCPPFLKLTVIRPQYKCNYIITIP